MKMSKDQSVRITGKTSIKSVIAVAMLLSITSNANATSAYLPNRGELDVTVGTTYQQYDRAWQAKQFFEYNRKTTIQEYRLGISYGITDRLSVDANGGYGTLTGGLGGGGNCATLPQSTYAGRDCQNPIPQGSRDGVLDSRIGLRYSLFSENPALWNSLPSVAVYAGALIEGDYNPRPQALGDGASGYEGGIAFGRFWSNIGFGVTADVNYANVSGVVPSYFYGSVGAYKLIGQFFVSGNYRYQRSQGGWDASGAPYSVPPGTPADSYVRDAVRILNAVGRAEDYDVWEVGLGYTTDNGTTIQGAYSETFDGRNTALRETFQLYVTVPIQVLNSN
jgi:hypothetical protein